MRRRGKGQDQLVEEGEILLQATVKNELGYIWCGALPQQVKQALFMEVDSRSDQ